MKNFIALLLLLFTVNTYALDQCMEGAYSDLKRDGEGIDFKVINGTTFGFFYTYGESNNQQWFTFDGVGPVMKLWQTRLFSYEPFNATNDEVGSVVLTAVDNNTVSFQFSQQIDLVSSSPPFCFDARCERSFIYPRLTPGGCE